MKRLPQKQSRKNSAKRKRRVAARLAQAGYWKSRPQPMMRSGTVGTRRLIDKKLRILRVHPAYHESDHVSGTPFARRPGGTSSRGNLLLLGIARF